MWIFCILLNVCIISKPHELNPTVSLILCFPLIAVIKKVEVTKKSENQSRSPSRKSVLKATVRHPRATQHHICAKRKPTGDHTITGRLLQCGWQIHWHVTFKMVVFFWFTVFLLVKLLGVFSFFIYFVMLLIGVFE